jgi:hypothetical protein
VTNSQTISGQVSALAPGGPVRAAAEQRRGDNGGHLAPVRRGCGL